MSTTLQRIEGPGDAALIAAVRGGDTDAYGLLFERHVDAAHRLARQLVRGPDADDLVSEAFAKVLVVLQRGDGPDLAFRAYLLTAVRRLHVDRVRAGRRVQPTDDLTPFDPGVPFHDTAVSGFESAAAARAFASLPERWQLVLWHTEVEGQKPADVAPLLDMSPNSVSALAYRAREGLRQAFLTMHAGDPDDDSCGWVHGHLGGYVRGGMARRDQAKVAHHLELCRPCAALHLELTEVNSELSGLLAPVLLGSAAAAYVAAGSTGGSAVAGGVLIALLDRAKDVVGAHVVSSSVAGAAATAVIGGSVAVTVGPDVRLPPASDPPSQVADPPLPEPPPLAVEPERPEPSRPDDSERSPAPPPPSPSEVQPSVEVTETAAAPSPPVPAPTEPPPTEPAVSPPEEPDAAPSSDATQPGTDGQPEEDPAVEQYDVALEASATQAGRGVTRIRVTVTGLPPGRSATLTSLGEGLVVGSAADPRCRPTTIHASLCTVEETPAIFDFLAHGPRSGSIAFEVAVDGEGTDTDPANNRASVAVP